MFILNAKNIADFSKKTLAPNTAERVIQKFGAAIIALPKVAMFSLVLALGGMMQSCDMFMMSPIQIEKGTPESPEDISRDFAKVRGEYGLWQTTNDTTHLVNAYNYVNTLLPATASWDDIDAFDPARTYAGIRNYAGMIDFALAKAKENNDPKVDSLAYTNRELYAKATKFFADFLGSLYVQNVDENKSLDPVLPEDIVSGHLMSVYSALGEWNAISLSEQPGNTAILSQALTNVQEAKSLSASWNVASEPTSRQLIAGRTFIAEGLVLYAQGQYTAAHTSFQNYLSTSVYQTTPDKVTASMMDAWSLYKQKQYAQAVTAIQNGQAFAQNLDQADLEEKNLYDSYVLAANMITSGMAAFPADGTATAVKVDNNGFRLTINSSTVSNPAGAVVFMDAFDNYNPGATTFNLTITNTGANTINGLTIGLIDAVARAEYEKPVAQQDQAVIKAHTRAITISATIAPGASVTQAVDRNASQVDANIALNNVASSSIAGDVLTFTPSAAGAYAAISLNPDWSAKVVTQQAPISFNLANFSGSALSGLSIVLSDANNQSLTFTPASVANAYAHGKTLVNGANSLTLADFYQVVKPYGTATIQQQSATSVAIANMDTTVRLDLPVAAQSAVNMASTFEFDLSNVTGSLAEMKVVLLNAAGDSLIFKAARTLASYCPGTHVSIPMSDLFVNVGGVKTAANATNLAAFGQVTAVVLTNTNVANIKEATLSGIGFAGQADTVLFPFDFTQVKSVGVYVQDGTVSNVGFGSVVLDGTAVHINSAGADFQGPAAAYSVSTQTNVPVQMDISNDRRQQW